MWGTFTETYASAVWLLTWAINSLALTSWNGVKYLLPFRLKCAV